MTNRATSGCQPEQQLSIGGCSYELRHESQPVYRRDVEGRANGELALWQHTWTAYQAGRVVRQLTGLHIATDDCGAVLVEISRQLGRRTK